MRIKVKGSSEKNYLQGIGNWKQGLKEFKTTKSQLKACTAMNNRI